MVPHTRYELPLHNILRHIIWSYSDENSSVTGSLSPNPSIPFCFDIVWRHKLLLGSVIQCIRYNNYIYHNPLWKFFVHSLLCIWYFNELERSLSFFYFSAYIYLFNLSCNNYSWIAKKVLRVCSLCVSDMSMFMFFAMTTPTSATATPTATDIKITTFSYRKSIMLSKQLCKQIRNDSFYYRCVLLH